MNLATLNSKVCYEALKSRDKRFDGRFFVGVKSTKIYCRNICRVKLPKEVNCTFYANASQAEKAGYRPCLKCRPELAPGLSQADSVSKLAGAIAARLEELDGESDSLNLEDLAKEFNISSRHLRRVVELEFGVSPVELLQTKRLLLAKRLLTDTNISVTQIAMASGFNSIRRFNALFQERYRLKPTQLRKERQIKTKDTLECLMRYQIPYDYLSILKFLKVRCFKGVEHVDIELGTYSRTVKLDNCCGWIHIENLPKDAMLKLTMSASLAPVMPKVISRVKRLFDLSAPISDIEEKLGKLVKIKGLRVPGSFDGFEMVTRVILGQQVSVSAATTLSGRLAQKFSTKIETPFEQLTHLPVHSSTISGAALDDICKLGIVSARAKAIKEIAQLIETGELNLEPTADIEQIFLRLRNIKGIGDWTVQVIAMRALSYPDAFPTLDLGIKKALGLTKTRDLEIIAEQWRPWRAYACMHLWSGLEDKK
ncbi:MAG: DNA-3-methyladenine glycosylase 2 family protein [Cyanobacteria bacterium TGS_CYA1]|nr:DNA-3-methyladenine glycosylase 2 family protein [Cyanobacteria bacterium TGS_CYA1]